MPSPMQSMPQIWFPSKLCTMGSGTVSMGAVTAEEGEHSGGGALERGHGALLEPLAQLGDPVGGVGAIAIPVEAAELVLRQAATSWGVAVVFLTLTQTQTLWGGGALEIGDLCLLEDGSERGGSLDSDLIVSETVRDG